MGEVSKLLIAASHSFKGGRQGFGPWVNGKAPTLRIVCATGWHCETSENISDKCHPFGRSAPTDNQHHGISGTSSRPDTLAQCTAGRHAQPPFLALVAQTKPQPARPLRHTWSSGVCAALSGGDQCRLLVTAQRRTVTATPHREPGACATPGTRRQFQGHLRRAVHAPGERLCAPSSRGAEPVL